MGNATVSLAYYWYLASISLSGDDAFGSWQVMCGLGCSILDPRVPTRPCTFINSRLNFIRAIKANTAIDTIREFHEF
jgi:hypothetical protein